MTIEIAKIVQITETDKALLAELQQNTVASQVLRQEVTEDQSCDFTSVPSILQEQSMKAAFAHLQELGPPSSYANRFWQNFWVNSDDVNPGRTLNTLGAVDNTEATSLARGKFSTFSAIVDRGEVIEGASIDEDNINVTINQTGIWMVSWSAAFAFYPLGFGNQAFGGMTINPTSLTAKVKAACGVVITDGATQRYAAFADTVLTGKHMKEGTPKVCSGSQVLKLNQGSKLGLHMSRSGGIGTYMNNTTSIKEVLGMRKLQNIMTGGIPNRDTANVMSLVRLS